MKDDPHVSDDVADITAERILVALQTDFRLRALAPREVIEAAYRVFPNLTKAQSLVLGEMCRRIDPQWGTGVEVDADKLWAEMCERAQVSA